MVRIEIFLNRLPLAILQFLLAVLRTWRSRSIKSYIPFSPQVCGGLVLYFSFTSLSIVLGLFLQPLHSGLFIFLYRHLYRRTQKSAAALERSGATSAATRC
jgi:hypothetical protein